MGHVGSYMNGRDSPDVIVNDVYGDDVETVLNISGGVNVSAKNISGKNIRSTGVRVSDSTLNGQEFSFEDGDYGLDLLRGARGTLMNAQMSGQLEDSIRYDRNVLYDLYDVEAMSLNDRVRGRRVTEDQEMMLNDLLNTTLRALSREEQAQRAKLAGSRLMALASAYSLGDKFLF